MPRLTIARPIMVEKIANTYYIYVEGDLYLKVTILPDCQPLLHYTDPSDPCSLEATMSYITEYDRRVAELTPAA